jgi:cyclopropane fatty-acyl-phospholipid synthase-like methyltransferase
VLCHAGDKQELLSQLAAALAPGGVLVFSDIMGADEADEAALRAFTDRNATTALGRPSGYKAALAAAGLEYVAWWDNSHHLERYFRAMLAQMEAHEAEMRAAGLSEQYLENWRASLRARADTQAASHVFAWGVFVARKPEVEGGGGGDAVNAAAHAAAPAGADDA